MSTRPSLNSASGSPSKVFHRATTNLVTLRIGPPEAPQPIEIDRAVLNRRSKFFQNALEGEFREAQDNVIDLTAEDPEAVTDYLLLLVQGADKARARWLYKQDQKGLEKVAKIYFFAGFLGDEATQSEMVHELEIITNFARLPSSVTSIRNARVSSRPFLYADPITPNLDFVFFVYDQTPTLKDGKDKLRHFLVDYLAAHTHRRQVQDILMHDSSDLPEDFANDMMVSLMQAKNKSEEQHAAQITKCQADLRSASIKLSQQNFQLIQQQLVANMAEAANNVLREDIQQHDIIIANLQREIAELKAGRAPDFLP